MKKTFTAMALSTTLLFPSLAWARTLPTAHRPQQPPPTAFLQQRGAHLWLHGRPYRFGGANIYWLQLDENVGGVAYPTFFRIRDALLTARKMGATVVRTFLSVGSPLSIEPTLGHFNPKAFQALDYAVYEAGKLHLHLMIGLVDNWAYYEGSIATFIQWFRLSNSYGFSNPQDFYTRPEVIHAYEQYVSHVLDHVNPYTGLAYKNDPTIAIWELGNELNHMPASWVDTISTYIHQAAPRQLVAAGQEFGVNPGTLTAPHVNIVDVHYYPPTAAQVMADAKTVTSAGKVFIAGEYASTSASPSLLAPIARDHQVTGAAFWSLFAHNDRYGYVQHHDGFTIHYPGDTPTMAKEVKAIEAFDTLMNPQAAEPSVIPGTPVITSITSNYGKNVIAWRGTAVATGYTVERSTAGPRGPWTPVSPPTVTDNQTPWSDIHAPHRATWYRVIAHNAQGVSGPPSRPVSVAPGQAATVYPLGSWTEAAGHRGPLAVIPVGSRVLVGPLPGPRSPLPVKQIQGHPIAPWGTVVGSSDGSPLQITWTHWGLNLLGIRLHVLSPTRHVLLRLQTSSNNGVTWKTVTPSVTALPGSPHQFTVTVDHLTHVTAVRVRWVNPTPARPARAWIYGATLHYQSPF